MSEQQKAYFSAVAGPLLLVSVFLTAGLALARLDPEASQTTPTHSTTAPSTTTEPASHDAKPSPNSSEATAAATATWVRVNYAYDQVGANYAAGHSFWITVTDNIGSHKATSSAQSISAGGWSGDGFESVEWTPEPPDIVPGDFVYFSADDGYFNAVEVGWINGTLNVANDSVSGPITAPFAVPLDVACHPWGAWDAGIEDAPVQHSSASPDGTTPFTCRWNPATEWDIQPGQRVAVMYFEPDGDRVINVFVGEAVDLAAEKRSTGGHARPGGVVVYSISYGNNGNVAAENTEITDSLPISTAYRGDNNPFPFMTATNSVTWILGTLDSNQVGTFQLWLDVAPNTPAGVEAIDSNCVAVSSSTTPDSDPSNDVSCSIPVDVWEDEVELGIDKWAVPSDPTPGHEFDYFVQWCNHRGAAAGPVVLTDTLPIGVTLLDWQPQNPEERFWFEVSLDATELVLSSHGLPGDRCEQLTLRLELSPSAPVGTTLINHVQLEVADDVNPSNNSKLDGGATVSPPRQDLTVGKRLEEAVLAPGGRASFSINYGNLGNVETSVTITDTMPPGFSYLSGVWGDATPWAGEPLPDPTVVGNLLVWNLPTLPVNQGGNFWILLAIDGGATPAELENCAEIAGDFVDATPDDNIGCANFVIHPPGPNLKVRKWHDWQGDGILAYRVRFDNIGDQVVTSPTITDTLPAGTTWNGWWELGFDESRLASGPDHGAGQLRWTFTELLPGETGRLYFNVDLAAPGAPLQWFTNTVEITTPAGDTNAADNSWEDVAFSGGEVERVELLLDPWSGATLWGRAVPDSEVAVSINSTWIISGTSDVNGDWELPLQTPLDPGDQVQVSAGAGLQPVSITIPDPLNVEVDTAIDEVSGQIGGWASRPVEVHGAWPAGFREVTSDGAGSFLAVYYDIPRGAAGSVRFLDQIDYAEVVFHRPFRALDLILDVNYGHDWVEGLYEPGHTVWITVTERDGTTVKGTAELQSGLVPWWEGDSGFSTNWQGWQGEPPDLLPRDWVFGEVDNGFTNAVQLGRIDFALSLEHDSISGLLDIPWFVGIVDLLDVECWPQGVEAPPKNSKASPDGSVAFVCQWDPATEWDIQPGAAATVAYREPDGDRIYSTFDWPQIVASIGPASGGNRFVWGHRAEPDASVLVTVTTELGVLVASAAAASDAYGNWASGTDLPEGSLATWNEILVDFGNAITDTLTVYPMGGEADPATDVVTVTAAGPPFFSVDLEICHSASGCQWFGLGEIGESGTVTTDLQAQYGYDLVPGSSLHAQLNVWRGHQLRYSWGLPAPELGVWKWHFGGHARPGGVAVYGVRGGNYGSAPAENVVIVDTLPPGTSYYDDTSGLPVTIGASDVISWDLGTLDPGQQLDFAVTLGVDPAADTGEAIIEENCLQIETTSPGDWHPNNDASCSLAVNVWDDEVELGVDKWAVPTDPAPGEEFDYVIGWCNSRGAAAGPVVLTDTLPIGVTLLDWRPQNPQEVFWTEVSATGSELVLYAPGLPGHRCEEITLRVLLDEQAEIGATLVNVADLDVADDVDPSNNWKLDTGATVGPPRQDLTVGKRLEEAVLAPGGRASFSISYGNLGNVETSVTITDTMPPGFSYLSGVWGDATPWAGEPFPDPTVVGNQLVWNLPALPVNQSGDFWIELAIDENANPGEFENCVEIAGEFVDATPDDNIGCIPFAVNTRGPNLKIRKWHSWNGDGQLGYTVRFDNIGDEVVESPTITDTLPADTAWDGWWDMDFDWGRLVGGDLVNTGEQLIWSFSEILPGETGRIWFNTDLAEPGALLRWYTNTVEITTPTGDTTPADNSWEDVAFSGGEVERVEIQVHGRDVWGYAPRGPVTVTTASEQTVFPGDGDFSWTFEQPLLPGQTITVTADAGLEPVVIVIPDPFDAQGSSIEERVWGQIDQLDSEVIEVFYHGGPTLLGATDANGFFEVLFADIPRGASGEVRYPTQIDYAEVVFHRVWQTPDVLVDVNYAHDWVAGRAAGSASVEVVLSEAGVGPKAHALVDPDDSGFFFVGCGDWNGGACPDIPPGDLVLAEASSGFTTTVEIGTITGTLDVDLDTVSGVVSAPWFVDPLGGSCEVWVEGGPAVEFEVEPTDGPYTCDLSGLWDLQPGQDVAVRYREPDGDSVIDVYREPAPRLRIEKSGVGDPGEGGNFLYHVDVWNDGGAPAESVVITDTLPVGTVYIADTSSLPVSGAGAGPIVWDAGALDPGQHLAFDLYVEVAASAFVTITNSIEIRTSSPFDGGDPSDKTSDWAEQIQPNDTHLTVAKWSRTPDPAPGEDFFFVVNVCNEGTTGSTEVTLTDTFHPLLTLVDWQTGNAAWYEVTRGVGELVLAVPSIAGNTCSRVRMTMLLDPGAQVGQLLTNSAVIAAENDLETEDNEASWDALVTEPRLNLAVEKRFDSGVLVPGGSIRYTVDYVNNGNLAVVGPVYITDTFPAGTTFVSAWHNTWQGGFDFPPTVLTPELAVWELSGLDNSAGGNFDVLLAIAEDATPGTLLRNRVEVSPQSSEASYDDNTSTWDETVRDPGANLRVVKEHDWNEDRSALAYDVRFDNIGTEPTSSFAITDTLPAGTSWDGTWNMDFDWGRLVGDVADTGDKLIWQFTEIRPGESGLIWFGAALDSPQAPLDWYTNTVQITIPVGDVEPGDNSYEDVAEGHTGEAAIEVEKLTNGVDADEAPGVEIAPGQPITWTYIVVNTGLVELTGIAVSDDQGVDVLCPKTVLAPGERMDCAASGVSHEGPYENIGTVLGYAPTGEPVSDSDPSHYLGGTIIFADEFESGETSKWDGRAPP